MKLNKIAAGSLAAGAMVPFICQLSAAERNKNCQRSNIILIITDQQTAGAMSYIGNSNLYTPNMDKLASHGVVFQNAYCTAPLSGPSRTAMFTGHYPEGIGMIRNGAELCDSLKTKTLGNIINTAGYECVYAGKWHVNEPSIPDGKYGFKKIYDHKDPGLAEACVEFLKSNHIQPFFLVASFDNPHNICEYAREQNLPWGNIDIPENSLLPALPKNFKANDDDADVIITEKYDNYSAYPTVRYTERDWQKYRYAYFRLVEKVDMEIGKIIDEIDNQNLWKNTVIIFTSDHGDGIGAHHWNQKSALYEEVVNIPLVVALPEKKTSNKTSDALISNGIDIFASICEIAGVSPQSYLPGRSFIPIIEGNKKQGHEYIVCETTFDKGKTRGWMLRTEQYKYVLYNLGKNREQLFDIANDKLEENNLAHNKNYNDVLQNHRNILAEWMKDNKVKPSRPSIHDIPGKILD